jgi:hypothetical protein
MIDDNLTVLIRRLQRYADDPMWDSHAEVPKILLLETIEELTERKLPVASDNQNSEA